MHEVTINLLNPTEIILGKFKVFRVHPLVERGHDSHGIIGVFQSKGMAQLMHRYQEEIITCGRQILNITGCGRKES